MVTILDCTIRDGSYAVDFKFTASDTAAIAGALDSAGVPLIEVGHGLGLGASEAGKGRAGSRDLEVIERTREQVTRAQIAAFFIPGIGRSEHITEAAAAGLQVIRLGNDADALDTLGPSVDCAREAGLTPYVNAMKSYGVTPAEFGRAAATAESQGAAGIYVVDSAGGMLPAEVAAYVRAARDSCSLPVGFHGHENLHLAVANCIAAIDAGATLIDSSVYGIGRSSGNVPTEVIVAVLDRLGVDCGVDALDIIDLAETWLVPIAEHLHPHDMTAVSLGYGRFHSGFLPRVLAAAEREAVNPFRLIVALGREDMMRITDQQIDAAVAGLRGAAVPQTRPDLGRFSHPGFRPSRVGNRPEAIDELLDGIEVVAAKRPVATVLDLVASTTLDEEDVTAEFVLEDERIVLGRVRFGSAEALIARLSGHASRIRLAIVDLDNDPGPETLERLAELFEGRVMPYRTTAATAEVVAETVRAAVGRSGVRAVSFEGANAGQMRRRTAAALDGLDTGTAADGAITVGTGNPATVGLPGGESVELGRDEVLRLAVPRWIATHDRFAAAAAGARTGDESA